MEELQDVIFRKHVSLLETSISLIFFGMSHSFACHEVGSSVSDVGFSVGLPDHKHFLVEYHGSFLDYKFPVKTK